MATRVWCSLLSYLLEPAVQGCLEGVSGVVREADPEALGVGPEGGGGPVRGLPGQHLAERAGEGAGAGGPAKEKGAGALEKEIGAGAGAGEGERSRGS